MKWVVFIQLQLIFIGMVYLLLSHNNLNQKIFNTNKFVYDVLKENRVNESINISENELFIGNDNAKINLIAYTRFDCAYCNDFFNNNLDPLINDYIKNGELKLVFRFLTHESKPSSFFAVKAAYFANENGFLKSYLEEMAKNNQLNNDAVLNAIPDNLREDFLSYAENEKNNQLILNRAKKYRQSGINQTPTFFVDQYKVVGNVSYKRIKSTIEDALSMLEGSINK